MTLDIIHGQQPEPQLPVSPGRLPQSRARKQAARGLGPVGANGESAPPQTLPRKRRALQGSEDTQRARVARDTLEASAGPGSFCSWAGSLWPASRAPPARGPGLTVDHTGCSEGRGHSGSNSPCSGEVPWPRRDRHLGAGWAATPTLRDLGPRCRRNPPSAGVSHAPQSGPFSNRQPVARTPPRASPVPVSDDLCGPG